MECHGGIDVGGVTVVRGLRACECGVQSAACERIASSGECACARVRACVPVRVRVRVSERVCAFVVLPLPPKNAKVNSVSSRTPKNLQNIKSLYDILCKLLHQVSYRLYMKGKATYLLSF